MKVALFITCVVGSIAPEIGQATVEVLERLGVTVDVPLTQTCCATSDIELNRVEGIRGPRTVDVILVSRAPTERHKSTEGET
jgi:L-lactate utilization protein LutC